MSDLTKSITSINNAAERAENTSDFLDNWSTYDENSYVTNPNNNETVASAAKLVKDRTDELYSSSESDINDSVAAAKESEENAKESETNSKESEDNAKESEVNAKESETNAALASEVASLNAGVYSSTSDGILNTSEGDYFSVPSESDDGYLTLYLHDSGDVASEIKTYPSLDYVLESRLESETYTDEAISELSLKKIPRQEGNESILWAVTKGETILGYFDSNGVWVSDHTHENIPLTMTNSKNDAVWGVAKGNSLLGYFNSNGVWVSDHTHDGLPVEIPNQEDEILYGVSKGGTLLFYVDGDGKFHADIDSNNSSVSELEETIATQWLIREVEDTDGNSQIFAHDGVTYEQKTIDGYTWVASTVHSGDVIRCLSNYYFDDLSPYTILPSGELIPEDSIIMQQLVVGQSLSLGSRGFVLDENGEYEFDPPNGIGNLFTTECPEDLQSHCLTLENGPRPWGTEFAPTREYADGVLGETVCSSYAIARARHVRDASNGTLPRLVSAVSGQGGVPYDDLMKGTSNYSNAIGKTNSINSAATSNGWKHAVQTIRIIHGESQLSTEITDGATEDGYAAILREWVSDYQTDLVAITGQKINPVGVLCQMNTGGTSLDGVTLASLKAHEDNDDIYLIGPKYQWDYFDGSHMLAEGYIKTGELEAKTIAFWQAGKKWEPLRAVSSVLSSTTLTVTFNNVVDGDDYTNYPIGSLVIDTDQLDAQTNYGFEIEGNEVSISSVTLGSNGNDLVIELSAEPSAGSYLTYAIGTVGKKGNLRDSDERTISRYDGKAVNNWCVAHKLLIN